MLDHALAHASRGLHVFACERFLGIPNIDSWYVGATTDRAKIIKMWADDPTADIGCVPEKSGHYVIVCTGELGRASLEFFEAEHGALKPAFHYRNFWDAEHFWFVGSSPSIRIDEALHLIGDGRFVYLNPSFAPDTTAWSR
jgi:hypothetical protein